MGRPVLTGIWNNGGTAISRSSLQATVKALTTNLYEKPVNTGNGYTNVAWPTSNVTATLTTDFYDTYAGIPGLPATYTLTSGVSQMTTGLPTVKKTAILNTPADQLWNVTYYDDLARPTITYAQHYLGGTANTNNYDLVTTAYNFSNQPTSVTRQHWNTASATIPLVTVANTYLYDHVGRKTKTWEQITNGNSAPTARTLISKIDYNEIGQVLNKHLHSTDSVNYLQNIAYTYNERGWLTVSSAPLFTMSLFYNTGTLKAYNGNIRYQYWGTPGNEPYYYVYTYDKLNRLTTTVSQAGNDESGIGYDLMGNITALQRHQASTLIDNLAYTYTGNQLQSVADASGSNTGLVNGTTTYTWDGNGNLLNNANTVNTAQNKSFTYNLLNLPQTVTVPTGTLTYTYDAAGNKLRKVAVINSVTTTTDYVAGIQYKNAALDFIQTEEGKAAPNGTSYDYIYYLGDNLGNTRITFGTKTGTAVSYQKDDYYPFGLEINSLVTSPKNEYLYNRKELQEELGEYDFGARQYDPLRAQWNNVDPLSEINRRWSPYNYVENNPIRFTDPDGMNVEDGDCCGVPFINLTSVGQALVKASDWVADKIGFPGPTQTAKVLTNSATETERVEVHDKAMKSADAMMMIGMVLDGGSEGFDEGGAPQESIINPSQNSITTEGEPGLGKYSGLKEPNKVGEGLKTTKAQRDRILEANKVSNGGKLKSDISGKELDPPTQSKKGERANMNQAEVDHIKERAKGGSNGNENLRVISKRENLDRNKKEP